MKKFNRAAKRVANITLGSAEILAGTYSVLVGGAGGLALALTAPVTGAGVLVTAMLLGGYLAVDGGDRIRKKLPPETIYRPSQALPWEPGNHSKPTFPQDERHPPEPREPKKKRMFKPFKSKIVPWYKQPNKPEPQSDSGQWQAGDRIDPTRSNGTPWRHPGMPGDGGF